MEDGTNSLSNRFNRIQRLSRGFIPICWSIIFIIIVALTFASIHLSKSTSPITFSPLQLLFNLVLPGLFWILLLFMMARFFSSCCRYGIFSSKTISSIRWIGGIILTSAVIKLVFVGYAMVSTEFAAHLAASIASVMTNLIMGIFLLILGAIIAAGSGLEKEMELTV